MKKIKDTNKWLTDKSGLDATQRQQWRDKVKELMDKGDKVEAFTVFNSFNYYKHKYL